MATRTSGKQTAARITAVVAVGSFAVAGLGFVALENAPKSDAATTKASPSQDDDSSQDPGTSQNDDSPPTPSASPTPDTGQIGSASPSTEASKAAVRPKAKSTTSSVKKGNGGSTSGKSSGS